MKRTIRVVAPLAAAAALMLSGAPAASADSSSYGECTEAGGVWANALGVGIADFEHCAGGWETDDDYDESDHDEDDGLLDNLL